MHPYCGSIVDLLFGLKYSLSLCSSHSDIKRTSRVPLFRLLSVGAQDEKQFVSCVASLWLSRQGSAIKEIEHATSIDLDLDDS